MKKNKLIVIVVMVAAFIFGGFVCGPTAYAEGAALSVKAILPENQFNKKVSYYYLKVEPGDRQDLELEIFNSSNEDVTALVKLTAATTNDSGMIDYNLPDKKIDASMTLPFTDIASTPEEVLVPAGKSVITKISLALPADQFEGMILGGINIQAKSEEAKAEEAGGMKIVNEINYALGVVLLQDESLVKTNMAYVKTSASQVMGVNTTKIRLQNNTPAVIENLALEAQIFRVGSDEVLYETKAEGYRMAPQSNFDFRVPLGKERYRAGEYRVKVVATSDPEKPEEDGEKQVWTFDETFNVTSEEARKLNAKAVELEPNYPLYFMIGGLVLGGLALLVGLFIFLRKRKQKEEIQKEAESKKRKSSKGSNRSKTSKSSKSSKNPANGKRKRSSK